MRVVCHNICHMLVFSPEYTRSSTVKKLCLSTLSETNRWPVSVYFSLSDQWLRNNSVNATLYLWSGRAESFRFERIRQYDSCNTTELDRHAQYQQPCLASRMPRVVVGQEQLVFSGTLWSSFAHRQMSVILCFQRVPMKIENFHIRPQRPPQGHQRLSR